MNIHKNARLTAIGRERLVMAVRSGQSPQAAARSAGVCPRTARKWMRRFEAEGEAGPVDRSSRPHRFRQPMSAVAIEQVPSALDRQADRRDGRRVTRHRRPHPQAPGPEPDARSRAGRALIMQA